MMYEIKQFIQKAFNGSENIGEFNSNLVQCYNKIEEFLKENKSYSDQTTNLIHIKDRLESEISYLKGNDRISQLFPYDQIEVDEISLYIEKLRLILPIR